MIDVLTERFLQDKYGERVLTIRIIREDTDWFAKIFEMPGCMTQGKTLQETLENLQDAMNEWLKAYFRIDEEKKE